MTFIQENINNSCKNIANVTISNVTIGLVKDSRDYGFSGVIFPITLYYCQGNSGKPTNLTNVNPHFGLQ